MPCTVFKDGGSMTFLFVNYSVLAKVVFKSRNIT